MQSLPNQVNTEPSLKNFRPHFLGDLIRLGAKCDGGYVVNERAVIKTSYVMSFGINDDWSFEVDFLRRNPEVAIFCFDHSVSKLEFLKKITLRSITFIAAIFSFNLLTMSGAFSALKRAVSVYKQFVQFVACKNIHFHQKGISSENTTLFITFSDAFRLLCESGVPESSVFVKMDIEQFEFRVLSELFKFERFINGLVVEFHDLDVFWDNFVELTDMIRTRFELTHIHGNNWGGLIAGSEIPKVLELTFLKKHLITEKAPIQAVSYPIPCLDYANNNSDRDYPLTF